MKRHKKKTDFHKTILSFTTMHDVPSGITGLCHDTGIAYRTMRDRLNYPRGLRWYEYLAIVESLGLDEHEEAILQKSIKSYGN